MKLPLVDNFVVRNKNVDPLRVAEKVEEKGLTPVLNYLGEHYTDTEPIDETVETYTELIDRSNNYNTNIELSVKPTQLGLDIDPILFEKHLENIVSKANENDIFVWVDMENYENKNVTIDVYENIAEKYNSVGLCLQANLLETVEDVERLGKLDEAHIRLVKGAYNEPKGIAYQEQDKINESLTELITKAGNEIDGRIVIGTHDEKIIRHALAEHAEKVEFQMLRGVREQRQAELVNSHNVGQYIPFGDRWISYTYRRIRERPRNIILLGRSIVNSAKRKGKHKLNNVR